MNKDVAEVSQGYQVQTKEQGVPAGYKQTEVGVIPEDWESACLQDVATFGGGTTPARKFFDRYYLLGTHPWVKTLDLNNSFIRNTDELVTDAALNEVSIKKHKAGSVLVAMYGGFNQIGRTGLLTVDAAINQALVAIIPNKEKLVSEYLLFSLNFNVDYWKGVASSSRKDPNITSNDVKNYSLPLPGHKEQTAIANALSDVDALLSELEKLIAKKQAIKTATMQQLLTGRTRLPQFALHQDGSPKGYKQSELGEIPEDWAINTLSDLALIKSGGTPSTASKEYWDGNINWCTPTDITALHGQKYLKTTSRKITEQGLLKSSADLLPVGAIVMTSRATIGECAITLEEVTTNQGFKNFVCNRHTNNEFLYYLLTTLKDRFIGLCSGSTFLEISTTQVRKFTVVLPELEEQTAIATILSDMDAEIQALEHRLNKTRQIKQGMMQHLLTGKTRLVKGVIND